MDETTFVDELRRTAVNVPRAGLRFAREIAYPDLDVAYYMARLDELARRTDATLPAGASVAVRAEAIADYLFQEEGFRGNAAHYEDPRNSYLNEVLERRLGIPISLSVIFVAVARRLGLEAYGIALPGHFIAGVRAGVHDVWLDPFHGGQRLTLADCERLVRETVGYEGPLDPRWLLPAEPRPILARMLNNLRLTYLQQERWPEVIAVLERLRQVQPEAPGHVRDLGLAHYQQGDLYPAARYLEQYLKKEPDTAEAAAIRQNLTPAFSRWARLN